MSCGHELRHRAPTCHVCLDERTKERDEARALYAAMKECNSVQAIVGSKNIERMLSLEAECAAMREALSLLVERIYECDTVDCEGLATWVSPEHIWACVRHATDEFRLDPAKHALSGTAGRDLLGRLAKLEAENETLFESLTEAHDERNQIPGMMDEVARLRDKLAKLENIAEAAKSLRFYQRGDGRWVVDGETYDSDHALHEAIRALDEVTP